MLYCFRHLWGACLQSWRDTFHMYDEQIWMLLNVLSASLASQSVPYLKLFDSVGKDKAQVLKKPQNK